MISSETRCAPVQILDRPQTNGGSTGNESAIQEVSKVTQGVRPTSQQGRRLPGGASPAGQGAPQAARTVDGRDHRIPLKTHFFIDSNLNLSSSRCRPEQRSAIHFPTIIL